MGHGGSIKVSRGFLPSVLVKYAISKGYVTMKHVRFALVATQRMPADAFKDFVGHVYETQEVSDAKKLVNMLVGCMGHQYNRSETAGATNDFPTAIATVLEYQGKGIKTKLDMVGDITIIRTIDEKSLTRGDVPIYRHIIASSWIKLDELSKAVCYPKTVVIGYNTDSIKVVGKIRKDMLKPHKECKRGEYHLEKKDADTLMGRPMSELPTWPMYVHSSVERIETIDDINTIRNGSCLIIGAGGSGKSHMIAQVYDKDAGHIVLSATNKGCQNLKKRGVDAKTFDSFLFNGTNGLCKDALKNCKKLVIDEYTLVPPSVMFLILEAMKEYGFDLNLSGDSHQLPAVSPDSPFVDYGANETILHAVGGRVVSLSYKGKRYDQEMFEILTKFRETQVLEWPNKTLIQSYTNICYSNSKRDEVNKVCFERWVEEHGEKVVDVHGFKVCIGLPVMCYEDNIKTLGMFKTMTYKIQSIDSESVVLQCHDSGEVKSVSRKEFKRVFAYSFCTTTHKFQGGEIHVPYNILEAGQMSYNCLYTAVSRGTCIGNVHIVGLKDKYRREVPKVSAPIVLKKISLKTGHIYRIRAGEQTYIGQTTKTIEERFEEHKEKPANKALGEALANFPDATIELIESFKFGQKCILDGIEKEHIEHEVELLGEENVLNRQHAKPKKVKKEIPVARSVSSKFKVSDDLSKKRFEIQASSKGIKIKERFPYGTRNKEEVRVEAETRRQELLAQYL